MKTKKFTINPKKLRDIRRSRNLLQKDLANIIGVSESMLGYYENNFARLEEDKIMKLCVLLNCKLRDITGTEEEEQINNDEKKEITGNNNIKIEDTIKDLIELSDKSKIIVQQIIKQLKELENNRPKTNQVGDIQNSSGVSIVQN